MLRAERVVKHQIFFRRLNEEIHAAATGFEDLADGAEDPYEFLCECARSGCVSRIRLTMREYEAVRSEPTAFAVLPGHEIASIERVVRTNERFTVVVKFHPEPAKRAIERDPRAFA